MTWAVVPVKAFAQAKHRLAPRLGPHERADLARTMAADVLDALGACRRLERVVVVTADPQAAALATQHGAAVLEERPAEGLSGVLEHAWAALGAQGARTLLFLPADVPLVTAAEIDALVDSHAGGLTLVRATRDGGTNALLCAAGAGRAFRFGAGSCERHAALAAGRGEPVRLAECAGVARDIDTPEDLDGLAASTASVRSAALAREWAGGPAQGLAGVGT
jgi:2-phospho-L-lactate/phosphoenolpyruvate guanylyltransferase